MSFIRFMMGARLLKFPYERQKFSEVFSHARMSTAPSSPPPPPPPGGEGEQPRPRNKKKAIFATIGTLAAFGGMAYAYKVYVDEKYDPMDSLKWAQHKLGWSSHVNKGLDQPATEERKEDAKNVVPGSDSKASCAGKEGDCAEKKCEDSTCLRKMDKEEEIIAKANQDLEKALKDVKPKAMEATEAALKAYCEAAELIKQFMDKAYCAIEEDNLDSPRFEEVWCEVYEIALKRCEKVKDAIAKGQCAWELLCRLREVIENGKACKYTSCNPLLVTAEETLLCAERELLNAKAKMDCVQSESKLVEQYRNLVEDFRRDVKAEMESMLTGNPECKANLTENECAMILTHAYKKVLRVQKELSIVQAKAFSEELLGGSGLDVNELQTQVDEMKEFYEKELVNSLTRQAQVYHDSMELSKELMQKEFERRIRQNSDIVEAEQLVDQRVKYKQATSTLAAMEEALIDRKNEDEKAQQLRKLWTFSTALYNRINFAAFSQDDPSYTIQINKESLLKEFSGDEFVVQLLKTIPDQVGSSEQLRNRFFNKLDVECRKLGVFRPDDELSLGKYIVGYLQGSLITRCEGDKDAAPTNIYEILDRTAFHLRRGELLDAVAILNGVEGIPRQVCHDWLADARAVLEASQTLFALMSHANSRNQS